MIVDAAFPIPMPAPADTDRAPVEPFRLETTEGVDAEIVIVPPDAPTDAIPAPDKLKLFAIVTVVDAVPRVFPVIVAVIVLNWAEFEIVIVDAFEDSEIPGPATRDALPVDPFRENELPPPPPPTCNRGSAIRRARYS